MFLMHLLLKASASIQSLEQEGDGRTGSQVKGCKRVAKNLKGVWDRKRMGDLVVLSLKKRRLREILRVYINI